MQTFEWKLSGSVLQEMQSALNGAGFSSPEFTISDISLNILVYPNGMSPVQLGSVKIFVAISSWPKQLISFDARCKLYIIEADISSEDITKFMSNSLNSSVFEGPSTAELQIYNPLTFKLEIDVLSALNINSEDIKHKYSIQQIQKDEIKFDHEPKVPNPNLLASVMTKINELSVQFDKMQQTIKNIQLRINEDDTKDDRIYKLTERVNILEQNMKNTSLNVNNNNMNIQQEKLKMWLENKVKLKQYFNVFIESGIDDLETVCLLTKDSLKDMGIDKVGHQVKLLSNIKQLKENKNVKMDNISYNEPMIEELINEVNNTDFGYNDNKQKNDDDNDIVQKINQTTFM
eukprot:346899_1